MLARVGETHIGPEYLAACKQIKSYCQQLSVVSPDQEQTTKWREYSLPSAPCLEIVCVKVWSGLI